MKQFNVIWMLGLFLFLMSCKCSHVSTINKSRFIKPDSIVQSSLGDSLKSILFTPQSVNVYTLASTKSTTKEKDIAGYTIDSLVYQLKNEDVSIFQHSFLCDTLNYRMLHTVRAPFSPTFAFEFIKGESNIFLLFSFLNREWRIVGKDKALKSFVFRPSSLEQIASELLPNQTFE